MQTTIRPGRPFAQYCPAMTVCAALLLTPLSAAVAGDPIAICVNAAGTLRLTPSVGPCRPGESRKLFTEWEPEAGEAPDDPGDTALAGPGASAQSTGRAGRKRAPARAGRRADFAPDQVRARRQDRPGRGERVPSGGALRSGECLWPGHPESRRSPGGDSCASCTSDDRCRSRWQLRCARVQRRWRFRGGVGTGPQGRWRRRRRAGRHRTSVAGSVHPKGGCVDRTMSRRRDERRGAWRHGGRVPRRTPVAYLTRSSAGDGGNLTTSLNNGFGVFSAGAAQDGGGEACLNRVTGGGQQRRSCLGIELPSMGLGK